MTLLDRYLRGETTSVYNELYSLGEEALSESNFKQTDLILKETFRRVRINLDIIYKELRSINYQFKPIVEHEWQRPLLPPNPNVDSLLSQLVDKIKDAGQIPLSLEYFYKIVGSCNFCWDWESKPEISWEGADPIDIPPIDVLVSELVYDNYDREDILLSGDHLQKDNVSGSCYNIELTNAPMVDSIITDFEIPFIEYIRRTIENCGFTKANECDYDSLSFFCKKVRPQLISI